MEDGAFAPLGMHAYVCMERRTYLLQRLDVRERERGGVGVVVRRVVGVVGDLSRFRVICVCMGHDKPIASGRSTRIATRATRHWSMGAGRPKINTRMERHPITITDLEPVDPLIRAAGEFHLVHVRLAGDPPGFDHRGCAWMIW